jgi:hypothetical protein
MKKHFYFLIILLVLLVISCSNDSSNSSSTDEVVNFKFEVEGGLKFTSKIQSPDFIQYCIYSNFLNSDDSKRHNLVGKVYRLGNNPIYLQDSIYFYIEFTTSGDLQVNQIIQLNQLNSFSAFLPYKSEEYYSQGANFCNSLQLERQATSSGFVKITQITDDYVYGVFEFNNLLNVGGYYTEGGYLCPNYPSQQNHNIINGTFRLLK